MALFNQSKTRTRKSKRTPDTRNYAGGRAYSQSNELKLVSLLLTSFAQNQYYKRAQESFNEIVRLLPLVDPLFAAKAAIYARTEFGMRSITHVLAAELAAYASGKTWAKHFYDQVVYRPDDMLEIYAYFQHRGGRTIPNAMKKGFAAAFGRFDTYQLAKYQKSRHALKLVDMVNLVHPKPKAKNRKALDRLVNGKLRSRNTWESMLSQAGQEAKTKKERETLKKEAWTTLVKTRRIGYFALLRNLRNIAVQAPELIEDVCDLLTNEEGILSSMVLPFRFLTAYDVIQDKDNTTNISKKNRNKILEALNKAVDISLANVPKFKGKTLVVLDDSGSMTWGTVSKMARRPIDIGALFASVLVKANRADLMLFSSDARYITLKKEVTSSTARLTQYLVSKATAGGTNFNSIFRKVKGKYDRVIILSDMQGWMEGGAPIKTFHSYCMRTKCSPFVYSFDLLGYGTMQFPTSRTFCLAGFSDKVFETMRLLERDRNALLNTIKDIEF